MQGNLSQATIVGFVVHTIRQEQRTEQGVFGKYFSNTPQDFYISK
jgi:hypothetical protein